MMLPDIISIESCCTFASDTNIGRDLMCLFGVQIHNIHDSIITSTDGETSDEVDKDDLPRTRRGFIGLELADRFVRENLGLLTLRTCAHIMSNICSNVGPPVIAQHQLQCLVLSWMSNNGCVVVSANDFGVKPFLWWDIDHALIKVQTLL